MCPPFSNETAPTTAYMVCARTNSRPEAWRLSGYKKVRLAQDQSLGARQSNLSGRPAKHLLHVVFLRKLSQLCPVCQEALGAGRKVLQSIQRRVSKWHATMLVLLHGGGRGRGVLHESERSLQLHDPFSWSSCKHNSRII